MRGSALPIWALLAFAGFSSVANAAVLIKTFHFAICVTGEKHPDARKKVAADAHVVVSEDAMEWLDGKTGQAASIEAVTEKPAAPSSGQGRHRHRQDQQ